MRGSLQVGAACSRLALQQAAMAWFTTLPHPCCAELDPFTPPLCAAMRRMLMRWRPAPATTLNTSRTGQ